MAHCRTVGFLSIAAVSGLAAASTLTESGTPPPIPVTAAPTLMGVAAPLAPPATASPLIPRQSWSVAASTPAVRWLAAPEAGTATTVAVATLAEEIAADAAAVSAGGWSRLRPVNSVVTSALSPTAAVTPGGSRDAVIAVDRGDGVTVNFFFTVTVDADGLTVIDPRGVMMIGNGTEPGQNGGWLIGNGAAGAAGQNGGKGGLLWGNGGAGGSGVELGQNGGNGGSTGLFGRGGNGGDGATGHTAATVVRAAVRPRRFGRRRRQLRQLRHRWKRRQWWIGRPHRQRRLRWRRWSRRYRRRQRQPGSTATERPHRRQRGARRCRPAGGTWQSGWLRWHRGQW